MRAQPELIVWIDGLGVWSLVGRSDVPGVDDTPHRVTNVFMWSPSKGMCEPREFIGILET